MSDVLPSPKEEERERVCERDIERDGEREEEKVIEKEPLCRFWPNSQNALITKQRLLFYYDGGCRGTGRF